MKAPTDRQMQFASAIAEALGMELPAEKTRQSLFLFIRDNRPKYDARQRTSCEHWLGCPDRVRRHKGEEHVNRRFHTDDCWEGNNYDCPADVPGYVQGNRSRGFHTDDYWGGNDYDCPADDPNYIGGFGGFGG